jgi:hypothetical protein
MGLKKVCARILAYKFGVEKDHQSCLKFKRSNQWAPLINHSAKSGPKKIL